MDDDENLDEEKGFKLGEEDEDMPLGGIEDDDDPYGSDPDNDYH